MVEMPVTAMQADLCPRLGHHFLHCVSLVLREVLSLVVSIYLFFFLD